MGTGKDSTPLTGHQMAKGTLTEQQRDARTQRELKFITGLGTWSKAHGYLRTEDLQRIYHDTMHLRKNWDGIDERKVRRYLEKTLWEDS